MPDKSLSQFDAWLAEDGPVAIVIRQPLRPVEGKDSPLFPPTYAAERSGEPGRYNIDPIGLPDTNGTLPPVPNVCLVDSVGSQANRIEPAFKTLDDGNLVPQITIDVEGDAIHLLDAGHRVADAVVRFSNLKDDIEEAMLAYRDGDATMLARLAPTSLVFGAWDSRATQVKIPRLLAATIRAFDVQVLTRSAQYKPPKDYIRDGVFDDTDVLEDEDEANKTTKDKKKRYSEEGFLDVPATHTHGGVIATGGVRREATLNLATLREIKAGNPEQTRSLQRYILGLALLSLTHLDGKCLSLRQGCQLVSDGPANRELVNADGTTKAFDANNSALLAYAQAVAEAFGVGAPRQAEFDAKEAKKFLKMSSADAKKARAGKAAKRKKAAT